MEQLNNDLSTVIEALDDFDIDAAKAIVEQLKHIRFDENSSSLRETLQEAVEEMEYDKAMKIAAIWKEKLASAMF